ncbi:hypothetical protein FB567DRAFT_127328 [Paraphoma chrysanthemicola]|uniref:Uncharacterized protein n=1 Tax=Paraphoma chrysanthemicola TaxID=798071 RepID=A0A8K0R1U6_9PLEO|nr:hypothetical protein FB567DRAFT_127328 [Paraphoma chrysanthemicola]
MHSLASLFFLITPSSITIWFQTMSSLTQNQHSSTLPEAQVDFLHTLSILRAQSKTLTAAISALGEECARYQRGEWREMTAGRGTALILELVDLKKKLDEMKERSKEVQRRTVLWMKDAGEYDGEMFVGVEGFDEAGELVEEVRVRAEDGQDKGI